MEFINVRLLDIIDIFVFAILLYQVYKLIKGTAAINIFAGLFVVYLVWLVVKLLDMQLLGNILGQVMGVGVLALIIVFQQEIRKFLLIFGARYLSNVNSTLENVFSGLMKEEHSGYKFDVINKACVEFSASKTGALIVIEKHSSLEQFAETGEIIDGVTSTGLLESIFFKNSALHDGAVIIRKDRIYAAKCILPVTESTEVAADLGLRHRAAIGITEQSDALVIVVSEETGKISIIINSKIERVKNATKMTDLMNKYFRENQLTPEPNRVTPPAAFQTGASA